VPKLNIIKGERVFASHLGQAECENCKLLPKDCSGNGVARRRRGQPDDGRLALKKRLGARNVALDILEATTKKTNTKVKHIPNPEPTADEVEQLDQNLLLTQVSLQGTEELPWKVLWRLLRRRLETHSKNQPGTTDEKQQILTDRLDGMAREWVVSHLI
jgi:hypothetical protein